MDNSVSLPLQPPIDWRQTRWLASPHGLSDEVRANHEAAIAVLEEHNKRGQPYALLLRTFHVRQLYCHAADGGDGGEGILLEVHLQRVLQRFGANIIRVQEHDNTLDTALHNGTPALLLNNDSWLEAVNVLIASAELIMSECQFLSPGVVAELNACVEGGKIDQTVLILPSAPFEFIGNEQAVIDFPRAIQQFDLDRAFPARTSVFADLIERMGAIARMIPEERIRLTHENRLREAFPVTFDGVPEGMWQRACYYANQKSVGGAYFLGTKAVLAARASRRFVAAIEYLLSLATLCADAGNPRLSLVLIDDAEKQLKGQAQELHEAEQSQLLGNVAQARSEILGVIFEALLSPEHAEELWQRAKSQGALALERRDLKVFSQCLSWMSAGAVLAGNYELAIDHANDAITFAREVGDTYRESFASFYLGNAYRGRGDTNKAAAAFFRAVELFPTNYRKGFLAAALLSLGEMKEQLEDRECALQTYRSAREVAVQQGQTGFEEAATERISRLTVSDMEDKSPTG